MAREQRRACGYRKVGGLYLCADAPGHPCCKMPVLLHVCPTCNSGVKQTRGWQWLDPKPWIRPGACTDPLGPAHCPLAHPDRLGSRVGLLWIGEMFYPSPGHFIQEAVQQGVSRRIQSVPRGFKLGETWVWFAHPKVQQIVDPETGDTSWAGGVFQVIKPERIEKIVTEAEAQDETEMQRLRDQGITPVAVPDDDRDHQGSVYDRDPETQLL